MTTDARAAFIRRCARDILRRAHIITLKRLAERTAEAYARSDGSEAALASLLVHEDALEREVTRNGRDASK